MTNLILTETQPYMTNTAESVLEETDNDSMKIAGQRDGTSLNSSQDIVVESENSCDRQSSEQTDEQTRSETVV